MRGLNRRARRRCNDLSVARKELASWLVRQFHAGGADSAL
jgi:hypothetical protein